MIYGNTVKKDILLVIALLVIAIMIFYPLFYSEYAYTDEIVQLWRYKKGDDFQLFLPQGRYVTEKLFRWLFEPVNTVKGITYIRLFSFAGWMISIPIWYFIIKKIIIREKLPEILAFLSTLYLVCTPQFCIYVSWAACLELFLANTAGLLSGYFCYMAINERGAKIFLYSLLSLFLGVISLFTYQNGMGCFLLPFVLHLVSGQHRNRNLVLGIASYLILYVIYYLLFKFNLSLNHIEANTRTSIHIKPVGKVKFLFTRALSSSFHFTYVFNEKSIAGLITYSIFFGAWIIGTFIQQKAIPFLQRITHLLLTFLFFALIYLPSLLVKENYASNRTLLALNMAVFFLVAILICRISKSYRGIFTAVSVFFVFNALYNFRKLFLKPITEEYKTLRTYIESNYRYNTPAVYFIRPEEDFFVRKYDITRSWDELGVPSSFFDWVPEFLVKQIVFEKYNSRELADKVVVKHWLGRQLYDQSGVQPGKDVLLIDAEKILMQPGH